MSATDGTPTTCASESCGAPIIWAITSKHKLMPVDAEPSPNGNVHLQQLHPSRPPLATVLGHAAAQRADGPLHTSRFATCSQAASWRKGKPR